MAGREAEPVSVSGISTKTKTINLHFRVNKLKFYSELAFPMTVVVKRNHGHREDEECLCHPCWDETQHLFRVNVGLNVLCLCKIRGASYFGSTDLESRYFPVVLCIGSGGASAVRWDIAEWNRTDFYTDIYMTQLHVPTDPSYCSTVHSFRAMPSLVCCRVSLITGIGASGLNLSIVPY